MGEGEEEREERRERRRRRRGERRERGGGGGEDRRNREEEEEERIEGIKERLGQVEKIWTALGQVSYCVLQDLYPGFCS